MYVGLQALRAKVRGFHVSGEAITRHIRKSHGSKKHRLWSEKRLLGRYSREHQVAYGLLRDVPYERIERCAEQNALDPKRIFEIVQAHGDGAARKKWTIEAISAALGKAAS